MTEYRLNDFPLEEYYFLESRQFLDTYEKVYVKTNNSFKLNSYYLGMSKRRVNNDKLLYLFNGLRGYYDIASRFVKNPRIKETKPPMSKFMYNLVYKTRKYRYPDLVIYSLKVLGRPTITLVTDVRGSGESYQFPLKLVTYLNEKRRRKVNSFNYKFWKQNYYLDFKHIRFKFLINRFRYRKKSYRRLKIATPNMFGADLPPIYLYYFSLMNENISSYNSLVYKYFEKKLKIKKLGSRRGLFYKRNKRYFRRRLKRRLKFYKTKKLIQLLLIRRNKKANQIIYHLEKKKIPKMKNINMRKVRLVSYKKKVNNSRVIFKLKNKIRARVYTKNVKLLLKKIKFNMFKVRNSWLFVSPKTRNKRYKNLRFIKKKKISKIRVRRKLINHIRYNNRFLLKRLIKTRFILKKYKSLKKKKYQKKNIKKKIPRSRYSSMLKVIKFRRKKPKINSNNNNKNRIDNSKKIVKSKLIINNKNRIDNSKKIRNSYNNKQNYSAVHLQTNNLKKNQNFGNTAKIIKKS